MERKLTGRSRWLAGGGVLVLVLAIIGLVLPRLFGPSDSHRPSPSPSSKPSASPTTLPTGYVPPSKSIINSKGVFVARPDATASASVKALWAQVWGAPPPPADFAKSLGHVPVDNQTSLSQAQANTLGEEYLVGQGYLMYFLEEGSISGALSVSAGSAIGSFPQLQSVLSSGGHVETIGCELPTSLVLVSIPTPPGPISGASPYGFVESFNLAPGGSCSMVTISKAGRAVTLFHVSGKSSASTMTLQEGLAVKIPALGATVWKNLGSVGCPTYTSGESLTLACPSLLPGGAG